MSFLNIGVVGLGHVLRAGTMAVFALIAGQVRGRGFGLPARVVFKARSYGK